MARLAVSILSVTYIVLDILANMINMKLKCGNVIIEGSLIPIFINVLFYI